MDHMVHPSIRLCDIDGACYHALTEKFRNYSYDLAHGMMILYFVSTVYPEGWTNRSAVHNVIGMKLLIDGYCMATLFLHELYHSVKLL